MYKYFIKIDKWLNDDTFVATVDLGFRIFTTIKFKVFKDRRFEEIDPDVVKRFYPPGSEAIANVILTRDNEWSIRLHLPDFLVSNEKQSPAEDELNFKAVENFVDSAEDM